MGVTTLTLPEVVQFPGYTLATTGGQVFYVDSGGVRDGTTSYVADRLYTTLKAAMAVCRANRGDVIICLPQHSESITTTTTPTFVAGVTVVGIGNGDERPTFNFTAQTSTFTINVANVRISNCIFDLEATASTTVTKGFAISGAGVVIDRCQFTVASSATQLVATAIELASGANRCTIAASKFYGTSNGGSTNIISVKAAVARPVIQGNYFDCATASTTLGLIDFNTAAATGILVTGNEMRNSLTNATACISVTGAIAVTGLISYNDLENIVSGTANTEGIVLNGAALVTCYQNFTSDEAGKSGVLTPAGAS